MSRLGIVILSGKTLKNVKTQTMQQHALINLLNSMESKGLIAKKVNHTIQDFLDYGTKSGGKLFLILCGLIGASFISAGIFSLIIHNWDDFPKHVRGFLSLVPALVALYFYYLALFKHKHSSVWIETSSLFLMLMIGASIALVSSTYMLDSNFHNMIKVWLVLSLPLFYLARASGFSLVYLGLNCIFLTPQIDFSNGDFRIVNDYAFFWIFFIAYLPHLITVLNKDSNKQGIRAIYLGWLTVIIVAVSFSLAFKAGHLLWGTALITFFYILGKKYFSGNLSFIARPFQTSAIALMIFFLISITNDWIAAQLFRADNLRNIHDWSTERYVWYFMGLITLGLLIYFIIVKLKSNSHWNRYVIFLPMLVLFLLLIDTLDKFYIVDMWWLGSIVLNFYILFFAVNAMIQGNRYQNIAYMVFGLLIAGLLMWIRYFDLDYSFWFKGLMFIGVGGLFFVINYLSHDEYESE